MSLTISSIPSEALPERGFDALLGTAQNRYLGEGHRRVTLQMTDPAETNDRVFSCTARLSYPDDWSQKAGVRRAPHLSTVDAIRIAGRVRASLAADPVLAGFEDEKSLTVRAGARPWEQLHAVPVRTVLAPDPERDEILVQHSIGTLKVESRLARTAEAAVIDEAWEPGVESAISLGADARVQCVYERRAATPSLMSFLEAMMLTAQMSQVALYGGDPEMRDRSGNMWMRRARFVRHTPRPLRADVVELELRNRRNVVVGGRVIGTADVAAEDVFGVQVTASLATGS